MAAADALQGVVVHGLRVHADAGDPIPPQHVQLFPVDGVRTARLHGDLAAPCQQRRGPLQHPLQQRRRQGRGRAAAHIKGPQPQAGLIQQLLGRVDLPAQGVRIGGQQLALAHLAGQKAAIGAAGDAEGDADIQVGLPQGGQRQFLLNGDDLAQDGGLFGAHVKHPPQLFAGGVHVQALVQVGVQQPGGPDARQAAPGRGNPRALFEHLVDPQLGLAAAQALVHHGVAGDGLPGFMGADAVRHAHGAQAVFLGFGMGEGHLAAGFVDA